MALAACGSGGSGTGESPSTSAARVETDNSGAAGGGKSGATKVGGERGVRDYGEEASESELRQAAEAVHGFYVARAEKKWRTACFYLATLMEGRLDELAAKSPRAHGVQGCPALVKVFAPSLPPAGVRASTAVDARSLRRKGESGFLIYHGARGKTYSIPMHLESESWLVAALGAKPLD